MGTKNRLLSDNKWINLAKCIATVLVVMVHSENVVYYAGCENVGFFTPFMVAFRTIASFGVPIFFMVSAYLLFIKPFDWKENLKKKSRTILMPFVLWNVAWMLFELLGGIVMPDMFEDFSTWKFTDWLWKFSFDSFYIPFWFMWYLFLMNVLAGIVKWLVNKSQLSAIIMVLIVWYLPFTSMHASRCKQSFVFFIIGALVAINRDKIADILERFRRRLSVASLLTTCVMTVITVIFAGNEWVRLTTLMIASLAVLLFVVAMSHKWDTDNWTKCLPHTFIIYAVHGKIISIFQILATRLIKQTDIVLMAEYFVFPVAVIIICIVFSIIFRKLAPRVYSLSQGGR